MILAFKIRTGSISAFFASNPAPCYCGGKIIWGEAWASAVQLGDLDGVSGCCLWSGPALAIAATWKIDQQREESPSLFLCQAVFQITKISLRKQNAEGGTAA